jgi:hypothetical protein
LDNRLLEGEFDELDAEDADALDEDDDEELEAEDEDEDFPVAQLVGSTFVPENAVMQGTVSSEEEEPSLPSSGPLKAVTWSPPQHTHQQSKTSSQWSSSLLQAMPNWAGCQTLTFQSQRIASNLLLRMPHNTVKRQLDNILW